MEAYLTQIMESIQGEGMLVGSRQIFLRFSGCNLRCNYCDTLASLKHNNTCEWLVEPGIAQEKRSLRNPLNQEQIANCIKNYKSKWVTFTGGEPLLWSDFILHLGKSIRNRYQLLMETNGTLYEQMALCLPVVHFSSVDFKMPSAVGGDYFEVHKKFLRVVKKKPCCVKIVLTTDTTIEEIKQSCAIIKEIDPYIPLILQPVISDHSIQTPSVKTLLHYQALALEELYDVRLLPQIHKFLGLL